MFDTYKSVTTVTHVNNFSELSKSVDKASKEIHNINRYVELTVGDYNELNLCSKYYNDEVNDKINNYIINKTKEIFENFDHNFEYNLDIDIIKNLYDHISKFINKYKYIPNRFDKALLKIPVTEFDKLQHNYNKFINDSYIVLFMEPSDEKFKEFIQLIFKCKENLGYCYCRWKLISRDSNGSIVYETIL